MRTYFLFFRKEQFLPLKSSPLDILTFCRMLECHKNFGGKPSLRLGWITDLGRWATLEVALEGLAGDLLALNPAVLHLHYSLLVAIEPEAGFATKGRATTTVDVIGQILDRRPTSNDLANSRQSRHPALGLGHLRLARLTGLRLAMTREGLHCRHCHNLLITHRHP